MNTKKEVKYVDKDGDGVIDNYRLLESGQRIMVKSFLDDKYMQLYDELEENSISQFDHKVYPINDPFVG